VAVAGRGAVESRHRAAAGRRNGARRRRVPRRAQSSAARRTRAGRCDKTSRRAGRGAMTVRPRDGLWLMADGTWRIVRPTRAISPQPSVMSVIRSALTIAISLQPFAMSVFGCARAPGPVPARAHNLLLITIDTLRADHVGAYGYTRARTPTLDGLAAVGAPFHP